MAEKGPFLVGSGFRRLAHREEQRVLRALAVRQELIEQARAEIRGAVDLRELLEEERHPRVILDPVQAHPRHAQEVLARVVIRGLVEMPKERQVNHVRREF